KSIGYEYDSRDTLFHSIEQFDRETLLSLAQKEHLRWWKEKLANGWKYAPISTGLETAKKTIPEKEWDAMSASRQQDTAIREMRKEKLSHLLTDWENLELEEQLKDLKAVENIIPLLHSIGLRVYKIE
ncbi:MAG: hypothetical protein LBH77_07820, partial [Tannerella sp.]|nr:hypothetical protein [Tannerella sp.]